MEGDPRLLTFANGSVAREVLVDLNDDERRLVYAISNERLNHYNASVQVFRDDEQRSRVIWTVDVLPNEVENYIDAQMDEAKAIMKRTLEHA